jgi:hypothetical protein
MTKPTVQSPTLRELYPDLADEDLGSAAEALDRYIDLVARITERIAQDPDAMARHRSLTRANGIPTMTDDPINSSDQ